MPASSTERSIHQLGISDMVLPINSIERVQTIAQMVEIHVV